MSLRASSRRRASGRLLAAVAAGAALAGCALVSPAPEAPPAAPVSASASASTPSAPAPAASAAPAASSPIDFGNRFDHAQAGVFEARDHDWRDGAVVYQVFVDRFAPSRHLDEKRALYPAPKRLRAWSEQPTAGRYLPAQQVWSHEVDFWGGDLDSLRGKLDYLAGLGADVVYLNPIDLAYTNHKYDALDYRQVSPEYGTRADFQALARDLHARGMKLVLDGVFNHMGRQSPHFQSALHDPASPWRDWFFIGPQYPGGARAWAGAENLPELNLENPQVRDEIWAGRDSVVRTWLRDGADGWRLDVAFELGFRWLGELTQAAHDEKPGSLVVGEIANYPQEWFPSVDGLLGFTMRDLLLRTAAGRLDAATASRMITRVIDDAGIEPTLKSWLYLDNHDKPRLATALPDAAQRHLAQVLQFTLPGSPLVYYGSEVDMTGGDDPAMRGPMRWDRVRDDDAALRWTRRLIALHRGERALRIGDYRPIDARQLVAFERRTDRVRDTVLVFANPSSRPVRETVLVPDSKLMDNTRFIDLLGTAGGHPPVMQWSMLDLSLPAHGVLVLRPDVSPTGGYTNYKRVQ